MNSILLTEVSQKIRNNPECLKGKEQIICETISELMELEYVARKNGLLELEEIKCNKAKSQNFTDKIIGQMFSLIVDGTDPKDIEDIMVTQYMFANYNDAEQFMFYLICIGCLMIQAGENPETMLRKLKACVPSEYINSSFREMVNELYRKRVLRWKPDEFLLS